MSAARLRGAATKALLPAIGLAAAGSNATPARAESPSQATSQDLHIQSGFPPSPFEKNIVFSPPANLSDGEWEHVSEKSGDSDEECHPKEASEVRMTDAASANTIHDQIRFSMTGVGSDTDACKKVDTEEMIKETDCSDLKGEQEQTDSGITNSIHGVEHTVHDDYQGSNADGAGDFPYKSESSTPGKDQDLCGFSVPDVIDSGFASIEENQCNKKRSRDIASLAGSVSGGSECDLPIADEVHSFGNSGRSAARVNNRYSDTDSDVNTVYDDSETSESNFSVAEGEQGQQSGTVGCQASARNPALELMMTRHILAVEVLLERSLSDEERETLEAALTESAQDYTDSLFKEAMKRIDDLENEVSGLRREADRDPDMILKLDPATALLVGFGLGVGIVGVVGVLGFQFIKGGVKRSLLRRFF